MCVEHLQKEALIKVKHFEGTWKFVRALRHTAAWKWNSISSFLFVDHTAIFMWEFAMQIYNVWFRSHTYSAHLEIILM